MIPPSFSDLGKAAKDLFDKKFKFGAFHVECTSKQDPITLTVTGSHDLKTRGLTGNVEMKHSTDSGVELKNKWSTKNVFTTEISKEFKSIKGLKNIGVLTFEPDSGKKSLKASVSYKRDYFNLNTNFNCHSCKPEINSNVVFGCTYPKPYLAGADITLDTNAQHIKNYTFALGYEKSDFGILATVKDLSLINAYVYQRISKHTDIGVHMAYDKASKNAKYELVGDYKIPGSDNAFIRAKINQDSLVGVVYGSNINDGVQLTLSTQLDGKKLEAGPHNFGIGIVYEP